MSNTLKAARACLIVGAMLAGWLPASLTGEARGGEPAQAQVLSRLTASILRCSIKPCLGAAEHDVRQHLADRIVPDGVFSFTDVALAYPDTRSTLHGLVEWDFNDELDAIAFKLVGFEPTPSLLKAEVVRAIPGCEVVPTSPAEDPSGAWQCLVGLENGDTVLIDVTQVSGLLLFVLSH